ncbi:hypothetical protein [Streptomyces sp. NRRL B-24484]|uniref:hypothetical protein n=1 Tax=Streptomyces sp. NRRL B-24484 TaxID=1463833 RepID=UPI0004BFA8F0|nr:hypothetical protein [Streptomyces sp. NRRL B-24484]
MDDTSQIDVPTVIAIDAAGRCATVRVEPAVATAAVAVLDQCAVLQAGESWPEGADVVADGLRLALIGAGIPPAVGWSPSEGELADELGRRGRDRLAARIGDAVTPGCSVTGRVPVEAAVLAEAVAHLRCFSRRFDGEPIAAATRRLWEQLYLCLPLTALAAQTGSDGSRP